MSDLAQKRNLLKREDLMIHLCFITYFENENEYISIIASEHMSIIADTIVRCLMFVLLALDT